MKEETRLKKEELKKKIKDKYNHYFDLLVNSGGALNLKDFSILLNIEYTKTTRDLKYIEENTNIIKSYTLDDKSELGTPKRSKVICLTRAGWKYLTGKNRNEVIFENPTTMSNNKLKAFRYCRYKKRLEENDIFRKAVISNWGNAKDDMRFLWDGQELIDIDEFFKKTKFTITQFSSKSDVNVEVIYVANRLSIQKFLEEMDLLLGLVEYVYFKRFREKNLNTKSDVKFNIKVRCILRHRPDVALFVHLKNKYQRKYHYFFTDDINVPFNLRRNFKVLFKEVYKRVDFYKLEDNYELTEL